MPSGNHLARLAASVRRSAGRRRRLRPRARWLYRGRLARDGPKQRPRLPWEHSIGRLPRRKFWPAGGIIDEPAPGSAGRLPMRVHGWAMFPAESTASVELTLDGRRIGRARVGVPRPDVAAVYPFADARTAGWEYELNSSTCGSSTGWGTVGGIVRGTAGGAVALPTVTFQLAPAETPCPGAAIDQPDCGARVERLPVRVHGWAMFPSESVTRVELTADGQPLGLARVGLPRPDVAARCGCADAPISGWEYELAAHRQLPPSGRVVLGGTVHGSAGGAVPLPSVTIEMAADMSRRNGSQGGPASHPAIAEGRDDRIVAAFGTARQSRRSGGPNILVFTHLLTYGGGQLYLVELLERLARQGLRFTVVSPADGPLRERLERTGAEVHLSPPPIPWQDRMYGDRVAELACFAAPRRFDLVLVNTISVLYGLDVAERLGLPSILAVHESLDLHAVWAQHLVPHDPAVLHRMKSALSSASTVLFEAAATRELFLPYGDSERLVTMPYGIDLRAIDRFRSEVGQLAARSALGLPPESRVILCLGTIEPRKAQASLARAFARVAERYPEALLALVGRTDEGWCAAYADGIVEYLERAGMGDRVRVAPLTANPFQWHVAADVLVCASDNESLPRVILEAMAFDTLVVSTDIFGIPEVVEDGVTGFLYGSRDEREIAQKLTEVLVARPKHRKIRAAAAERVRRRHDADAYATAVHDLIDELMGHRTSANMLAL